MESLQRVRAAKNIPILMLTALNMIDHRLEGFERRWFLPFRLQSGVP